MLNAIILLFGWILILIISLPLLLARLHDRKMIKTGGVRENIYLAPQKCWLFTKRGITISILSILTIPILLYLFKYYVYKWLDVVVLDNTRNIIFYFLICVMFILFGLALWWSYISDFIEHRNDYIRLGNENIEICYKRKRDVVNYSDVAKINIGKKAYVIYRKGGHEINIPKSLVNRLINRDKLKGRLQELSLSLQES